MRVSKEAEHERFVHMLKESIQLLCRSSLSFERELNIDGLLGITLDKKDIFLVNIGEAVKTEKALQEEEYTGQKRSHRHDQSDIIEIKEENDDDNHATPSRSKRRCARRRSHILNGEKTVLHPLSMRF